MVFALELPRPVLSRCHCRPAPAGDNVHNANWTVLWSSNILILSKIENIQSVTTKKKIVLEVQHNAISRNISTLPQCLNHHSDSHYYNLRFTQPCPRTIQILDLHCHVQSEVCTEIQVSWYQWRSVNKMFNQRNFAIISCSLFMKSCFSTMTQSFH